MSNIKKTNTIKKVLASASAAAVIVGVSNVTMAGQFKTSGGGDVKILNDGIAVNAVNHPGGNPANWQPNDSFFFEHSEKLILHEGAGAVANPFMSAGVQVSAIDLNNIDGITIESARNSSIGSIIDSSGNGKTAELIINARNLTLSSNNGVDANGNAANAANFSALSKITFDRDPYNANLRFNVDTILTCTIDSKIGSDDTGSINLDTGKNVVFQGKVGGIKPISGVFLSNNGSNITFDNDIKIANRISIGEDTVVNLKGGNLTGDVRFNDDNGELNIFDNRDVDGDIVSPGDGGKLKFLGSSKVTGEIGGTGHLVSITANGAGTVVLDDSVKTTLLDIKQGGIINAKHSDIATQSTTIKIGEAAGAGVLIVDANADYNLNINSVNAANILFAHADSQLKLTNSTVNDRTVTLSKILIGDNTKIGKLEINSEGTNSLNLAAANGASIGTDNANRMKELIVSGDQDTSIAPDIFMDSINITNTANINFTGAINADTVDVRDNATAKFDHATFNADMEMHGVNSKAEFTKKMTVANAIKANVGGQGTVDFQLGAVVNSDIGAVGTRLKQVSFAGDSNIDANIHSDAIAFGKNAITLNKDATFDGKTTFNDSTIVLDGHNLTLIGGDSVLTGDVEITSTVVGTDLGNIIVGAAGKLDLSGMDSLKITLDDAAGVPVNGENLKLIEIADGGSLNIDLNKITVESKDAFVDWKKAEVGGELVLSFVAPPLVDGGDKAGKQALTPVEDIDDVVVQNFGIIEPGSEAHRYASLVNSMDEEHREKAAAGLRTTMNEIEKANLGAANDVTQVIVGRLPNSSGILKTFTSRVVGVSSGDEDDKYGIWATSFYSKIDQKMRGTSSGYKVNNYGGTLGFDFKANEDMILGTAFSVTNSEVKHRDTKFGDRTKVASYLFSLYGRQQFDQNWFGQGVFSIGSSSSNNKEGRFVANGVQKTAQGKYSSMMFSGEVMGGYNHAINEYLAITPMLGLNYSRINATAYRETGESPTPLLDVEKRASHKLNIVGGVKLATAPYIFGSVELEPEIHGFIRYDVIGRGAKVDSTLPGQTRIKDIEPAKLQKTFCNFGTSLNISYGTMDYGVSADLNLAEKYVGMQGSLKARINF